MIEIINDFVNGRKELWLEPRLKKATTEEEHMRLHNEAAEKFSVQNWLQDAAKRAGQLSITTHPSKFTHPSAKSTSIIAINSPKNDGYLRTGNVQSALDVFGNAAAMDVYRFLSLQTQDNEETILDAFENNNEDLEKCITRLGLNFKELQDDFLKIKHEVGIEKTDHLLKQVYFPIGNDQKYHLLSIVTASGIITELKQRIDGLRFSEDVKEARTARREGKAYHKGYSDLFDLTIMGYGGTKPQNISVLNNQNYGRSYLLASVPPLFEKRSVRLPTNNFFIQTLYLKAEKERFIRLHQWVKQDRNNKDVRQTIQSIIDGIIEQILYKAYQVRQNNVKGWSNSEHYQNLHHSQKIWLDDEYEEDRQMHSEWRDDVAKQMSKVIIAMYDDTNQIKILGDPEFKYIADLIVESLEEDKEFF